MIPQVGLDSIASNQILPPFGGNINTGTQNPLNSGLFPQNSLSTLGNNYSNDVMMSSIDFDKILGSIDQQLPISQQNFTSNTQIENSEPTGESDSDEQESCNSNIAKIVCTSGGFLAPLAGKFVSWIKGENPKTLFKFKQLAVTCPILAVAGLGIGMLLDSCINAIKTSNKAKEKNEQPNLQQNIAIPQKMNSVA